MQSPRALIAGVVCCVLILLATQGVVDTSSPFSSAMLGEAVPNSGASEVSMQEGAFEPWMLPANSLNFADPTTLARGT